MSEQIEISLSRGYVAIIDSKYEAIVTRYKWCAVSFSKDLIYASSTQLPLRKTIMMHRLIMDVCEGQFIDHIDGNGLNNRITNLRLCSKQQNSFNRRISKNNNLRIKGVRLVKGGRFQARIKKDGISYFLGEYRNHIDAARAYDEAAIKYFGNFAKTNLILGVY